MISRPFASKNTRAYSAERPIFETLEERRLLTTLYGGQTFAYKDAADNFFSITLSGRIEAEFLAAKVNENNNFIRPIDLISAGVPDDVGGADLFAIYVTRSTPQSSITIVQISDQGEPTPFGDAPDLNVFPAQLGDIFTATLGEASGSGYLGARTIDLEGTDVDLEDNRPIIAMGLPTAGFGVIPPQPGNFIRAGLSVNGGSSLGRFIFDGTVSGFVNITGSIGDFYCGNLLTGNTRGSSVGATPFPDNFFVAGDARNILVKGFVGTDESATSTEAINYITNTDIQIGGTLGQFRSANHNAAKIDVRNRFGGPFLNTVQRELEFKGLSITPPLALGEFGGDPFFLNDTFNTPQYLPAISDTVFMGAPGVRVMGIISAIGDPSDYYALALLAGQTINVQSASPLGSDFAPMVGVYDPDGRLIATNFNNIDATETLGSVFQFTADRPGMYRFAVGDLATIVVSGDEAGIATSPNYGDYSLRIQYTGNVALGAVVSDTGNYVDLLQGTGIKVWRGDFGGLIVGDTLISNSQLTVDAPFGSLRVLRAGSLGSAADIGNFGLNLNAPFGHVGLVQSTAAIISLNSLATTPIGGDYQIIDAATTLTGGGSATTGIRANKAIGIIRAGDVTGGINIEVNADDTGRDGQISLIDVTGDFGSALAGVGPRISTNLGGNVGYIRVGGSTYRDPRFGTGGVGGSLGGGNTITVPSGRSLNVTDDSGVIVNIAPRLFLNPIYVPGLSNPADPRFPQYLGKPADFTVTTFPVFGSGGSAIVDVTTDRSMIFSSNNTSRDQRGVEIGQVTFTQGGAPVILQPFVLPGTGTGVNNPAISDTRLALDPDPALLDISLFVQGPTPISILDTTFGNSAETLPVNLIQNTSGGDLPIIRAASIGNLYASSVGTARLTAANTALLPREILLNTYPYIGERVGVVTGNIITVAATEAIGNVQGAVIGSVIPNSDKVDLTNIFEGITGSIQATELRYVDIGEGIASGGSGYDNRAGLFSTGQIRLVTNSGRGDIRGPVVSNLKINAITLTNGSIINANIGVLSDLADISDLAGLITIPSAPDPIDLPGYELGPITLRGNGGIIGSFIVANDIDNVYVKDGFGIFSSVFLSIATGRVNRIIADGYGIRDNVIVGGGSVTEINATGNGQQVNSEKFNYAVRLSEFGYGIDPFFGAAPNRLTDIHAVLGTTKTNRIIENVTNSGIIEDTLAEGAIDLNAVYAQRIRRSEFNFADRIDNFQTRGPIRDVNITTGRLRNMIVAGDVANTMVNVAGPIESFYVTGATDQLTMVQSIGASGRIDRYQVLKTQAGDVRTTGILKVLAIGRDILSTSRIEADEIPTRYLGGQVFGQIIIT